MKILILYTPRSGTNSIASYFLKQNPNYEYFNQPFTLYLENGIRYALYSECIKHHNVLVKSEISNFLNLNIGIEQLLLDFDKVVLISRKNKRDQSISLILADSSGNFLDNTKRDYYVEGLIDSTIDNTIERLTNNHDKLLNFTHNSFRFFYYEDLFYGDFSELFKYLEIEHIQGDFDEILDMKNKYRSRDLPSKTIKTLT
jgi:hypothetical protein